MATISNLPVVGGDNGVWAQKLVDSLTAFAATVATIDSQSFTGAVTAPTQAPGDADNSVATTAFVAAAVLTAQSAVVGINTRTAAYTLNLTDAGKLVEWNSASAGSITIPTNATVAFPVGTVIAFENVSTGALTIAAASGVTLNSPAGFRITTQWASGSIVQRAANQWVLSGFTVT